MTEDEAKQRWCPFARSESRDGANRYGQGHTVDRDPRCIGSACMAWRWAGPVPKGDDRLGSVDMAIAVLGTDEQRAAGRAKREAQRPGYCGLAGPVSQ